MTIEHALASENPIFEINVRLRGPLGELSEPEKAFWAVCHFVGDTMNGGLDQTMINSTGELTPVFAEFVNRYGTDELRAIVAELNAMFPGGAVPADRDKRVEAVLPMGEDDRLGPLTTRFYRCENDIERGLLDMVRKNIGSFNLGRRDSGKA